MIRTNNSYLVAKEELRKVLVDKGVTATKTAELAGISRPTMYKVLRGNACVSLVAQKICDALEIDLWTHFEFAGKDRLYDAQVHRQEEEDRRSRYY